MCCDTYSLGVGEPSIELRDTDIVRRKYTKILSAARDSGANGGRALQFPVTFIAPSSHAGMAKHCLDIYKCVSNIGHSLSLASLLRSG